ncbi:hypothetical protein D3C85_660390 [compost metagenome]
MQFEQTLGRLGACRLVAAAQQRRADGHARVDLLQAQLVQVEVKLVLIQAQLQAHIQAAEFATVIDAGQAFAVEREA